MNDETHFKFILSVQTKNQCSTYLSQALAHQRTIHLRPFSPQFIFRETKHCSANEHTHTINAGFAKVENARSKVNFVLVGGLLLGQCQITKFPTQNTDFPLTQKHRRKIHPLPPACKFFASFWGVSDLRQRIY